MITDFIPTEYIVAAIGGLVVCLVIYIIQAMFLSKFHKLIYGKGTALGWIPVCNTYLLGKLVVNKLVGWIMVIAFFLTGSFTLTVNDAESSYSILPESIRPIYTTVYSIVIFALFIAAIVKYVKLKKAKKNDIAQNSNSSSDMGASSGGGAFLGNNVSSQVSGIHQADMGMQPASTSSVDMSGSNASTVGMEPSNVNASPTVGVNPQTMIVTSQPEVATPSVNTVPPVMEASNVNVSSTVGMSPQTVNVTSQPEVATPSVSVAPPAMEPSNANVSPTVGMNPQNANVTPQPNVVSPSVNVAPPVMEPSSVNSTPIAQNTNVSSTSVEPSSMDMSKPVIDVFQFVNPEASSSQSNVTTSTGTIVESLQTDDTIK